MELDLESVIRKFRIQTLKGQAASCQLMYESLAMQLDSECLSDGLKAEIARRRDVSLKESYVLQLMVDLLERQEREDSDITGSQIVR
jgi:hypothetical protein